jgi:hypothetical protein
VEALRASGLLDGGSGALLRPAPPAPPPRKGARQRSHSEPLPPSAPGDGADCAEKEAALSPGHVAAPSGLLPLAGAGGWSLQLHPGMPTPLDGCRSPEPSIVLGESPPLPTEALLLPPLPVLAACDACFGVSLGFRAGFV